MRLTAFASRFFFNLPKILPNVTAPAKKTYFHAEIIGLTTEDILFNKSLFALNHKQIFGQL